MASGLPDEDLESLFDAIPCREPHIRQLSQLLCSTSPPPRHLVLHGLEATGKTLTTQGVLRVRGSYSIISTRECITSRHLLERTLQAVSNALGDAELQDGRCESISVFAVQMQRFLLGREGFILVFDGIDRQREASATLLPALALLSEMIPNLTIIFIVATPRPHLLHRAGVPHLHFPQYTRSEVLSIVGRSPQPIQTTVDADSEWLWPRFTAAVYDSLGQAAARDVPNLRTACERLWMPFVKPILDGHYGSREFSKLMVKNKPLFQSDSALISDFVSADQSSTMHLSYYTAHLLLAAYLASHNPPRTDLPLLSKSAPKRRKKRANPSSHHRKISRRLLGPQAFGLERLFAIYYALLGEERYHGGAAELMGQFATLVSLRLVLRTGVGEVLEGGGKWRCGVGWDFVRDVGRTCELDLEDFINE